MSRAAKIIEMLEPILEPIFETNFEVRRLTGIRQPLYHFSLESAKNILRTGLRTTVTQMKSYKGVSDAHLHANTHFNIGISLTRNLELGAALHPAQQVGNTGFIYDGVELSRVFRRKPVDDLGGEPTKFGYPTSEPGATYEAEERFLTNHIPNKFIRAVITVAKAPGYGEWTEVLREWQQKGPWIRGVPHLFRPYRGRVQRVL